MAQKKRKERRYVPYGVAHIHSTFNNTIITITDPNGAVLAWASGRVFLQGNKERHALCCSIGIGECCKESSTDLRDEGNRCFRKGTWPRARDSHKSLAGSWFGC